MKLFAGLLLLLLISSPTAGAGGRAIEFPDVPGYLTLICDFHLHTVFSDGSVWPDIRVQEAIRDGLDCIAMTEHLELLPHRRDIPLPDHNRSYDLAAEIAADEDYDLIVLRGAEVTRSMPPGHANAIFLEDANPLVVNKALDAFRAAGDQGAFIFWAHPHWTPQQPDGIASLSDTHRRLIEDGLLHGIEVVNDRTYSDEALAIALAHDLTLLGTSDIHGLVDWRYGVPDGGHRPVTLLFAEERSAAGIRGALDARRTAVWFENTLIGKSDHLRPLIEASLTVTSAEYWGESSVLKIDAENRSDAELVLKNRMDYRFHDSTDLVTLAPHAVTQLMLKTRQRVETVDLVFEVLSAVTAPNQHPEIVLPVKVEEPEPEDEAETEDAWPPSDVVLEVESDDP